MGLVFGSGGAPAITATVAFFFFFYFLLVKSSEEGRGKLRVGCGVTDTDQEKLNNI